MERMNRLEKHFLTLREKKEKALILFLTAGDPDLPTTFEILCALAENGVDCIELGMPFSDPIADGPIIQQSSIRALGNAVNIEKILALLRRFRETYETPVVVMGYYNPIIRYGSERFVAAFKEAGGDGLIIADLPYEEGEDLEYLCNQNGISLVYLLAPEIGSGRAERIVSSCRGFVYCLSNYGTTGAKDTFDKHLDEVIRSLKSKTDLPVAIGFGISSLEQAQAACKVADGIIIGSWLIRELEKAQDKAKVAGRLTKNLKGAISLVG